MSMDYIKGAVVHAIITEACRRNRGDVAVIEEAIQRLRNGWASVSRNWPIEAGGRFHVVLISEPPECRHDRLDEVGRCRNCGADCSGIH